jgi:hypothetical protein
LAFNALPGATAILRKCPLQLPNPRRRPRCPFGHAGQPGQDTAGAMLRGARGPVTLLSAELKRAGRPTSRILAVGRHLARLLLVPPFALPPEPPKSTEFWARSSTLNRERRASGAGGADWHVFEVWECDIRPTGQRHRGDSTTLEERP